MAEHLPGHRWQQRSPVWQAFVLAISNGVNELGFLPGANPGSIRGEVGGIRNSPGTNPGGEVVGKKQPFGFHVLAVDINIGHIGRVAR